MCQFRKVFGIGLNKTGTSSLGSALKLLGLRHKPWSNVLLKLHFADRHDQIFRRIAPYDAFEDWPWPLMVPELLDRYGDKARYVLTRRSSPDQWVASLKRHAAMQVGKTTPRLAIYGFDTPNGNEAAHIALYEKHLNQTRALFDERGLGHCLLEMCFDDGDGWHKLCTFMETDAPRSPFPHLNASAKGNEVVRPDARRLIQALNSGGLAKRAAQ